jgi:hypothetical protein
MMIGRRTFIQGTALVATAPVLTELLSLSSSVQSQTSPLPGSLSPRLARTDMNCVVFRIQDGIVATMCRPTAQRLHLQIP